ncbi:baseplate J/gp47 family protein [Treponema sp. SP13]|uniref:baseplate J/gp47 family protein n=1 Tax=Treponema sp. SP13 TaxID=2789742 RepID=UPI003D8D2ED0
MAYGNTTIDGVYTLLINALQEKFNNRLRLLPKAFITVLAKVLAAIYIIPFKLCGWFFLQLFPDTASWDTVTVQGHTFRPLVKLGNLFGLGDPLTGDAWRGKIKVAVTEQGKTLAFGTQLKSARTGFVYCIADTVLLDKSEQIVGVYCTESGTDGRLSNGEELAFVSPLAYVGRTAKVTETTQDGTDDESEAHYRRRVINKYGTQPQGGALADYRQWALDVAGVLQVYPYNDNSVPGGVALYVAGTTDLFPDRVPGRALCCAVGKACTYNPETGIADRKPLTAIIDPAGDETYTLVKPVSIKKIDVYITEIQDAYKATFGATYKAELAVYFESREPYIRGLSDDNSKTNDVSRNTLISLADSVATSLKMTFGSVAMKVSGSDMPLYTLGKGELAALGNFYINGTLYEA